MIAAGLMKDTAADAKAATPRNTCGADSTGPNTDERSAEPIVIDVPPTSLAPVMGTSASDPLDPGGLSCPNCKRDGRVDMVDLVGQRNHMSCPSCGTMWQVHSASGATKPG